jgi:hypothetical protein
MFASLPQITPLVRIRIATESSICLPFSLFVAIFPPDWLFRLSFPDSFVCLILLFFVFETDYAAEVSRHRRGRNCYGLDFEVIQD